MTEDSKIKRNLSYLDDTLSYLVNNTSDYSTPFSNLYKFKFNRDWKSDNKEFNIGLQRSLSSSVDIFDFSISDNTKAQAEKFWESLLFLSSEGLIKIDYQYNVKITFKGILEYGKGGYLNKYKSEQYKSWLDSFSVYVTIAISLVSLLVGTWIGYLGLG